MKFYREFGNGTLILFSLPLDLTGESPSNAIALIRETEIALMEEVNEMVSRNSFTAVPDFSAEIAHDIDGDLGVEIRMLIESPDFGTAAKLLGTEGFEMCDDGSIW